MITFKTFVEARETKEQKAKRRKAEKLKQGIQPKPKKKENSKSKKIEQQACQLPSSDDSQDLNYRTEYLFKYRGRYFIDTFHSVERRFQDDRAGTLDDDQVVETLQKVGDKICNRLHYFSTKEEKIMFYYKKYDQGIVIAPDEDKKHIHGKDSNILDWIIVTWLTRGRKDSSAVKKIFFNESLGKYIVEDKGETYEVDKIVEI